MLLEPKISFCMTCKGRKVYLERTIFDNIRDASKYSNIEFILLDFNSPDGLESWAKEQLVKYIDEGTLKYYKLIDEMDWHASKSRNMSHRLATGDILCNLDADNFLGPNFAFIVSDTVTRFSALRITGHTSLGGRIAVHREDFFDLGGYDESFAPMGHLDNDFERRLRRSGVSVFLLTTGPEPLYNTDEQRTEFCQGLTYKECCELSKKKMVENDENKITRVNPNGFSPVRLLENWTKEIYLD